MQFSCFPGLFQASKVRRLSRSSRLNAIILWPCVAMLCLWVAYASAQDFHYTLSTETSPVAPGQTVVFRITATNLTDSSQTARLQYRIPENTAQNVGESRTVSFFSIPAGNTESNSFAFEIPGGSATPPDGSVIEFTIQDPDRALAVSSSATIRHLPKIALAIQNNEGTAAPGSLYGATVWLSNISGREITNTEFECFCRTTQHSNPPITEGFSLAMAASALRREFCRQEIIAPCHLRSGSTRPRLLS